jgi:hypothetical protein
MASEALRPGTKPGLVDIVEERFNLPAEPAIGRAEAARRVRAKIDAEGVRCERLDISDGTVHRGQLFDMKGALVPFPEGEPYERCYVGLVDSFADAQWGHPAFWAFVPAAGDGEVVLRPTTLPEHALGAVRLRPEPRP